MNRLTRFLVRLIVAALIWGAIYGLLEVPLIANWRWGLSSVMIILALALSEWLGWKYRRN